MIVRPSSLRPTIRALRFRDRQIVDAGVATLHETFTLYNTHLPYRDIDEPVRVRCAELIRDRLDKLAATAAPKRSGPEGTYHGFTGKPERRIDWILVRGLKPNRTETVTTQRDGCYPSDHSSVLAELDLTAR